MGCIIQLVSLIIGGALAYGAHLLNAPDIVVFGILLLFAGVFAIGFSSDGGIDFDIFD